jgi:hypothetical protein
MLRIVSTLMIWLLSGCTSFPAYDPIDTNGRLRHGSACNGPYFGSVQSVVAGVSVEMLAIPYPDANTRVFMAVLLAEGKQVEFPNRTLSISWPGTEKPFAVEIVEFREADSSVPVTKITHSAGEPLRGTGRLKAARSPQGPDDKFMSVLYIPASPEWIEIAPITLTVDGATVQLKPFKFKHVITTAVSCVQ